MTASLTPQLIWHPMGGLPASRTCSHYNAVSYKARKPPGDGGLSPTPQERRQYQAEGLPSALLRRDGAR
jgi:hypothetical protein